jgi:hypothetical protein
MHVVETLHEEQDTKKTAKGKEGKPHIETFVMLD